MLTPSLLVSLQYYIYILPPELSSMCKGVFRVLGGWMGHIGMPIGPERGPQPKTLSCTKGWLSCGIIKPGTSAKYYGGLNHMSLYVTRGVNRCFDWADDKICPVTFDF